MCKSCEVLKEETSGPMVRTLGKVINELEVTLKAEFSELDIIELEVN